MLVHLADVDRDDLAGYLQESYLLKAPASLRSALGERGRTATPSPATGQP